MEQCTTYKHDLLITRSFAGNLYQNDLSYQVSKANLNMYANDHQLHTVGCNANTMKASLDLEAA